MEWILAASVALIIYTFAGYPVLIRTIARISSRPIDKGAWKGSIDIVIVAFNEEDKLQRKIDNCLSLGTADISVSVIVASDGSSDQTVAIAQSNANAGVRLVEHKSRRGKAACLNDAIAISDSEVVVLADVRQEISENAIEHLTANFVDPNVGAVSGELDFLSDLSTGLETGISAYWEYEKAIRKSEASVHSVVGATGALYAIRRSAFEPIPDGTILDDVLIPMQIVRRGFRVVFEEGAKIFDQPSAHHDAERRRKVRTTAGNYQLLVQHPWLLSPVHNPIWLQFLSHKVLRLVAPWALVCAFASNLVLASDGTVFAGILVVQSAAYGSALVGLVLEKADTVRVIAICKAFLLLNWYAALGLIEFLTNRKSHLWR